MNNILRDLATYLSGLYGMILYWINISTYTQIVGAMTATVTFIYAIISLYYKIKNTKKPCKMMDRCYRKKYY
ncbi:MAG: hypothetical protein GYA62_01215 [Bacteroidales bacterium]|nr:hypothetical protein [Bacteroidales bacterium]